MNKNRLNLNLIEEIMMHKGVSQQSIAEYIGVSKASVSSWLKPEKFPRPNHLYKLAKFLGLEFNKLVIKDAIGINHVAFRSSGNYKITNTEKTQLEYRSTLLEKLIPFVSIDTMSVPPILSNPSLDYEYIQKVTGNIRNEINPDNGIIEFKDLIGYFKELHTILIPVLWGKSKKQGTHALLPDSNTNWVFINLDSKLFDFLFWMAHELGHAKAPYLKPDEGEMFADSFAGALLFSAEESKNTYSELIKISNPWERVKHINKIAEKRIISPITIYKEIEKYAKMNNLESLDLEDDRIIYKGTSKFNKKFNSVSESLFKKAVPTIEDYLKICKDIFQSDFFDILKSFLRSNQVMTPKFVADILDISVSDAHEIWGVLTEDDPE